MNDKNVGYKIMCHRLCKVIYGNKIYENEEDIECFEKAIRSADHDDYFYFSAGAVVMEYLNEIKDNDEEFQDYVEGINDFYDLIELHNYDDEEDIVYFELNNWTPGIEYPNEEPFLSWMRNDLNIRLNDEEWVKKNKLCVVREVIDMSINFCITAKREWIINNCPRLLSKHTEFLRHKDKYGIVCGRFGTDFLKYKEENIGIRDAEEYEEI